MEFARKLTDHAREYRLVLFIFTLLRREFIYMDNGVPEKTVSANDRTDGRGKKPAKMGQVQIMLMLPED